MPRLEDEADFVIVGTGAGGATAARVLAAAGASVIMVEEGQRLRPEDRPAALLDAMRLAVRDMCMQATESRVPMPILQGRAVGGSTAINSGIIWRLPDDVRDDWRERFGLGELVDERRIDEVFRQIEDELEIHATEPSILGRNNELMAEGAAALGLPGRAIHRNSRGCKGNARCLQGCPEGARQSMDISYVPRAIEDGARLHTGCRVDKIVMKRGRAVAVEGRGFSIRARRGVIVAAGVVHTPVLLAGSGVRHANLGRRFQCHPGVAMVGRFDQPVHMGFGAAQGYEIPQRAKGFKLEALALPPEMLAARLPGAGVEWQRRLADLGSYAQWCGQIRMKAHGRIRRVFGRPWIAYEPTHEDLLKAREVAVTLGRVMFAAGAKEIFPGVAGFDEVITDPARLDALEQKPVSRADFHLVASHLFGTACASADPSVGVVDPSLAVRGADGLYVMDASVFPTNLGVNPQHSIMAVVWQAAEQLAERARAAA
ncbi:MAG: GMC family oxidoreductase [Sandaracinaceae bacterium]|nr:GMC family oxidoreductase [Sandaracinaceae bacterium]